MGRYSKNRTRCIECGALLTPENMHYSNSHGRIYPRPECHPCHCEQMRAAWHRRKWTRQGVAPVMTQYPQFGQWLRGMATEIRTISRTHPDTP